MAFFRTSVAARELTTTGENAYTVPTNRRPVLIETLLHNHGAADETPELYMVPSGQSVANQYRIWGGTESRLRPGQIYLLKFRQFLEVGDFIHWKAGNNSVITAEMSITADVENTDQYKTVDAQFLGTSLGTLFQVEVNFELTLMEFYLHNAGSARVEPTIHAVAPASSASNANLIYGGANSRLEPGETVRILRNPHYIAGTTIQAKSDTASALVMKLGGIQEATA